MHHKSLTEHLADEFIYYGGQFLRFTALLIMGGTAVMLILWAVH